jgi:hypothetical protein
MAKYERKSCIFAKIVAYLVMDHEECGDGVWDEKITSVCYLDAS